MHTHLQTADSLSWQSHSDFHQRKFHCGLWIWEVDFKSEQQKQSTVKEPNLLQVSEGNTQYWSGAFTTHPPTMVRLPRKWPHIRGRSYWQKRYRLNLAMTQIKKRQYSILTWKEHLFCWVLAGTKYWLYLSWVCFLWKLHYTFWRNKRVFCDKDLMFLNLSWGKFFHLQKYLPEIFFALQNIFSEISFAKCVFPRKIWERCLLKVR